MDAAKSGVRIKSPNFRRDQAHWDKKYDPYWKYQQRIAKPGIYQDFDTSTMCYSAPASRFILDVLVDVGSGFLKEQVESIQGATANISQCRIQFQLSERHSGRGFNTAMVRSTPLGNR
jgi:hypothetical protein